MTPALAACAGILAFASAWELAGMRVPPALARAGARLRRRRSALISRGPGLAVAGLALALIAPTAPSRLLPFLAAGILAGGFLAPDALRERALRRRRALIVAALPDALDLLAVGAAAGRAPTSLLAEIAAQGSGPLASELAVTLAEVETGAPVGAALAHLRDRTQTPELGALGAALERSRRYGSPLADQLHELAGALRREERRRIADRAARAAPKIQLVIALVLVPSALLTITAALVAHADALFGTL